MKTHFQPSAPAIWLCQIPTFLIGKISNTLWIKILLVGILIPTLSSQAKSPITLKLHDENAAPVNITTDATNDFRSAQPGNWSSLSTWERFDGADWQAALEIPSTTSGVITVKHRVVVGTAVTADQVVVESTGTLFQKANMTFPDGPGHDLLVKGIFTDSAGNIAGPGNIRVEAAGVFNIQAFFMTLENTTFTNLGTFNLLDTQVFGQIGFNLVNNGLLNLDNSFEGNELRTSSITNTATISNTGPEFGSISTGTTFTNSGTLQVSGNLQIQGVTQHSGSLVLSSGNLFISGEFNYEPGASITGNGEISNSSVFQLNQSLNLPSTILLNLNGTLTGTGDLTLNQNFTIRAILSGSGTLVVNGDIIWNGGTLLRPLTVPVGRKITINDNLFAQRLGSQVTINGTFDFQKGTMLFQDGGSIVNNGVWNIASTGIANTISSDPDLGSIVNTGTMNKQGTFQSSFGGISTFTNAGTLDCQQGSFTVSAGEYIHQGILNLSGGGFGISNALFRVSNTAGTLTGTGGISIGAGSSLVLDGSLTIPSTISFAAAGAISGAGDLRLQGISTFSGATVGGTGTLFLDQNCTWTTGTLNRNVNVALGKTWTIDNSFNDPSLTLNADVHVLGTLKWARGNINVGNGAGIRVDGSMLITENFQMSSANNSDSLVINGDLIASNGSIIFESSIDAFSKIVLRGSMSLNQQKRVSIGGSFNQVFNCFGTLTVNLNARLQVSADANFLSTSIISNLGTLNLTNNYLISTFMRGTGALNLQGSGLWRFGGLECLTTVSATKTFTISGPSSKIFQNTFTNNGTIAWQSGNLKFIDNGNIINNGLFSVEGANAFSLRNDGEVVINGTDTTVAVFSKAPILNNGIFRKTTQTKTDMAAISGFTNSAAGRIEGIGTLDSIQLLQNQGTISPGSSPGILKLNAPDLFSSTSVLNMELSSNSGPGTGHDQLQKEGNLTLGGSLVVTANPTLSGGAYTIIQLTNGTVSGTFSSVTLPEECTLQVLASQVNVVKAGGCANPQPTVTAGGPLTFCAGDFVILTSSAATVNLWSNGATSQSITVTQSGNFSVLQTNANGCSESPASLAVSVVATPLPAKPVITPAGTLSICAGSNILLSTNAAAGHQWSTGSSANSITVNTAGTYTDTAKVGGCKTISDPVVVTIIPLPVVHAGLDVTISAGDSVILTATGAVSYQWSPLTAMQPANGIGASVKVKPIQTTTYTVTGTNASACTSTDEVLVTITGGSGPLTAPIISPATGTYDGPQTVTITSTSPGATIYYTTSGNTPVVGTGFTKLYSAPFMQMESGTIRAMAVKEGEANSPIAVSFITITNPGIVATPVISPGTGSYGSSQMVSITCATIGAQIYFTTSGNMPVIGTGFTKLYTGPFFLQTSGTIRAIGVKSGSSNSPVVVAFITITNPTLPAATPVITPASGSFGGPQTVSITCATPGSTIFFTTNGNVPRLDVPNSFTKTYTGSFLIGQSATIRAIATAPSSLNSGVGVSFITIGAGRMALGSADEVSVENEVLVFPNPSSSGLFTFEWLETQSHEINVEVLALDGRKIRSLTLEANQKNWMLDLSDQPEGLFLVRITSDGQLVTKRITKQ